MRLDPARIMEKSWMPSRVNARYIIKKRIRGEVYGSDLGG